MKNSVLTDSMIWIGSLLLGMILQPYLLPRLDGPFAAFTSPIIFSGLIMGIVWVLLRIVIHTVTPKMWPKWAFILMTIFIVPLTLYPIFLKKDFIQVPRSVLMFPLFIAGLIWGIYSEVKMHNKPLQQTRTRSAGPGR